MRWGLLDGYVDVCSQQNADRIDGEFWWIFGKTQSVQYNGSPIADGVHSGGLARIEHEVRERHRLPQGSQYVPLVNAVRLPRLNVVEDSTQGMLWRGSNSWHVEGGY